AVAPAIWVDVNGIAMEPSPAGPAFAAITDCASVDGGGDAEGRFSCTITGTWWIDIDVNPGLIGVPLAVTLEGGGFFGPAPAALSMDDGSFPPLARKRRPVRRENTPLASRAPQSTTSGHMSAQDCLSLA